MNAIPVVAGYQLRKSLHSRGFLLSLFAMPAIVLVSIGLGILVNTLENKPISLGVVDPTGWVVTKEVYGVDEPPDLIFFKDETSARASLDAEKIQAYYLLPAAYPQNDVVELVFYQAPGWEAQEYFQDLLRENLLAGFPEAVIERSVQTPGITVHALDTGRSFPNSGPTLGLLAPVLAAILYMFSIFPVAELVAGVLGSEKANRTIEMVMTSIRTSELIIGKLMAALVLLLIEIIVWVLLVVGLVWLGRIFLNDSWLWEVHINWGDMAAIILLSLSGLVFYISALVLAGAMFAQEEDVRQAASMIILPLFLPLYVLPMIIQNPESLIAQVFSFLPITSVQTLGVQLLFMPLPLWKVGLAVGLNLAAAGLCTWLAMQVFRIGMLRYGRRIRFSDLFTSRSLRRDNHVS